MYKEYEFSVTLNIELSVQAENEAEARGKLTDAVAEYFQNTLLAVDDSEVELLGVVEIDK